MKSSLQNQVIPELPAIIDEPQPTDGFTGVFKNLNDGLLYEHRVMPKDIRGRTHKARVPKQLDKDGNTLHAGLFWEGTAAEFRERFEKQ